MWNCLHRSILFWCGSTQHLSSITAKFHLFSNIFISIEDCRPKLCNLWSQITFMERHSSVFITTMLPKKKSYIWTFMVYPTAELPDVLPIVHKTCVCSDPLFRKKKQKSKSKQYYRTKSIIHLDSGVTEPTENPNCESVMHSEICRYEFTTLCSAFSLWKKMCDEAINKWVTKETAVIMNLELCFMKKLQKPPPESCRPTNNRS